MIDLAYRDEDEGGVGFRSEKRCLAGYEKGLMESHRKSPGCTTIRELVDLALKKYPKNQFMGTRELRSDGTFGPYVFKNYEGMISIRCINVF